MQLNDDDVDVFFLYDEWQIYRTRGRNQTAVFVGL